MLAFEWIGEELQLLPQRAVHWPRTRTLLIADAHFGKAATFRDAGVPAPSGTTRSMLERLDLLLDATAVTRLIVLGDLLHARRGRHPQLLEACAAWRARRGALQILLVRGNHDRSAGDPPDSWRVECVDHLREPPFEFAHEPPAAPRAATFSGHVHPAIRLNGGPHGGLRAACFLFRDKLALLPAFGAFTGGHSLRLQPDDRAFVVGPDVVLDVSPGPRPTPRRRARAG